MKKTIKKSKAGKTKGTYGKLKLNKETLKDLTVGPAGSNVRGGGPQETKWGSCAC
jgi:hypothetical protein